MDTMSAEMAAAVRVYRVPSRLARTASAFDGAVRDDHTSLNEIARLKRVLRSLREAEQRDKGRRKAKRKAQRRARAVTRGGR